MDASTVHSLVSAKYTNIAGQDLSEAAPYATKVSTTIGYTDSELAHVPESANLGLGCGAPVAAAALRPGDHVLDLGSGPGLDSLLAAGHVGLTGHVTGLDMLDSMLELAESNLLKAQEKKSSLNNVTFAHTILPTISMPDQSVDVVLSNCVLNLLPDSKKPDVWREIARVLKKDGRVCVSDVCARKALPMQAKKDTAMLVGCVAGAALVGEVKNWMVEAGLKDISIEDNGKDLNVYKDACCTKEPESKGCSCSCDSVCSATSADLNAANEKGGDLGDLNDWVGSFMIRAVKK